MSRGNIQQCRDLRDKVCVVCAQPLDTNDEPFDVRMRQRCNVVTNSSAAELPCPATQGVEKRCKILGGVVTTRSEKRNNAAGMNHEIFISCRVELRIGDVLAVLDDEGVVSEELSPYSGHFRVMLRKSGGPLSLDPLKDLLARPFDLVLGAHAEDAG